MRAAVLADIHGNLVALDAVLKDMEARGGAGQLWCLGDTVGYGPEPSKCIQRLRQYDHLCIAGNHEYASTGRVDTFDFNPDAAAAVQWTAEHLTQDDKQYLQGLSVTLVEGAFTMAHGSPRSAVWEYLVNSAQAIENFDYFKTPFCLIGHSHIPLYFEYLEEEGLCPGKRFEDGALLKLGKNRLIINPGSVGQPRDRDPRASYAIYDSDGRTIQLFRVPYDIAATQSEMEQYGLPRSLIDRLSKGV